MKSQAAGELMVIGFIRLIRKPAINTFWFTFNWLEPYKSVGLSKRSFQILAVV